MTTIPVAVLARAGELTPAERRMIDAHAQAGAELILRCFPAVAPLAAAVASHHERADGTGYPAGLRGTTIPTLGRLLAVADVYAALNELRPHRGRDGRAALTEILLAAEHGFLDRDYAAHLVRLSFYPVGTVVELTDGRVGVVVANHPNPDDPAHRVGPWSRCWRRRHGELLPHPEHVDLSTRGPRRHPGAVPAARRREFWVTGIRTWCERFVITYLNPRATRGHHSCFWVRSWRCTRGAALAGRDRADRMRNGADAWMRWGLDVFGAGHVLAAPLIVLVVILVWTWWRWDDRPDDPATLFFGIAFESCLFAFLLWQLSRNFGPIVEGLGVPLQITVQTQPLAQILTFIGAGIYEEVLFRLGLFAGLYGVLRVVHLPKLVAVSLAASRRQRRSPRLTTWGPMASPCGSTTLSSAPRRGCTSRCCSCCEGSESRWCAHAGYDVLVGVTVRNVARANARAGEVDKPDQPSVIVLPTRAFDNPVANRVHAFAIESLESELPGSPSVEVATGLLDLGADRNGDFHDVAIGGLPGRVRRRSRSGHWLASSGASTKAINWCPTGGGSVKTCPGGGWTGGLIRASSSMMPPPPGSRFHPRGSPAVSSGADLRRSYRTASRQSVP